MKLNRRLILLSVAALALVACVREEMPVNSPIGEESADLVTFDVGFSIPTGESPSTKAMADATPVIKNIYIAVFGTNNYLNEFVKAIPLKSDESINLDGSGNYKYEGIEETPGVFKYKVRFSLKPTTSKRYVHVLANVPEGNTPPDFGYVDEVMGKNLYTENDEDGYWQYLEFPSGIDGTSATTSRFNGLKLVRNFAKVSLDPGTNFTLVGFELYDTPTRGSFAAYTGKEVSGSDVTYNFYSGWVDAGDPTSYATVKAAYSGYLMPGATPLHRPESPTWTNTSSKFTYEHPASEDNPTFIVAKLTRTSAPITTKYYRLDILDNNGHKSPLLRNYHYTVIIDNISSSGFDTPEEALENPSDYNFTLSEESRDAYEIENNGAYMEVEYVEKVFTKAQSDVPFKYRYQSDVSVSPSAYSSGTVSDVSGEGEVTKDWGTGTSQGTTGKGPVDGWYTVTYDVADPANIGSDELVSSFYINAGEGKQMIQRRIDIVSMKKKQLTVTEWSLSGTTLTLTFTVPDGLRQSLFPIQFKFEAYDITSNEQILSPQTEGMISDYKVTSTGSVIYSLEDYFYSDYTAAGGKSITVVFKSPSAVKPEVVLSDLNDYFEPLDLGGSFATGLAANAIAKGSGHTTTLEFRANAALPMTLTLTNLTAVTSDPRNTVTLSGSGPYTFTPSVGKHKIVLQATTNEDAGTATIALQTPDPTNYPNSPATLNVGRYDKYVTGTLTQAEDLPLGTGQSTTFSFNYSARDLMPVTITAPGVDLALAGGTDGALTGSAGSYTYTPGTTGVKTFTITSKTNFEDAGTISLSMPYMTNPDPLTVKRASKIVIPMGKLILDDALHFTTPMYWRTSKVYSTSGTAGHSDYFSANDAGDGSNTGKITIDISSFTKADSTPVYFMYEYTQIIWIIIPIPIQRHRFASLTLSQLLDAAAGTAQTLTFTD